MPAAKENPTRLRCPQNHPRPNRTTREAPAVTGVWRGRATIFMRAILKARDFTNRLVWVADSFAGLPASDLARYPSDERITLHPFPQLAVPLERVQEYFRRYGLLHDQVRFLKGWFRDTMPTAPIERLAILRLDGDLYKSTIQALESLYHKLSAGGFVDVSDSQAVVGSRTVAQFLLQRTTDNGQLTPGASRDRTSLGRSRIRGKASAAIARRNQARG